MRHIFRRAVCLLLAVLLTASCVLSVFAEDIYLNRENLNYSSAIARTKEQCNQLYAHLSTVMDTRYTEKVYDLIYRAQYRLTLTGGDAWPFYNTSDDTTLVNDSVLGPVSIYASRGCNSYARYAAKYIRGSQGTLHRASDWLGRAQDYVPKASEIQDFIARYADVGERILTGYYNPALDQVRPHSLLFLAEDVKHEGFYFLCQDGDGNGQTLRYFDYNYMAARLRYHEGYGYALAIGDTNNGRDTQPDSTLFGKVDDSVTSKLYFSAEKGFTLTASGWALSKTGSPVTVTGYVDGIPAGTARAANNEKLAKIYPLWCSSENGGFSLRINTSAFSTGYHVLDITAQDSSGQSVLRSVRFYIDNIDSLLETPTAIPVNLTKDRQTVDLSGWAFDRSGAPVRFSFTVDGGENHPLTLQDRSDVMDVKPGCSQPDCGFALTLDFNGVSAGDHFLHIFAHCGDETVQIAYVPIFLDLGPSPTAEPVSIRVQTMPEKLHFAFEEEFNTEGLSLQVIYSDEGSRVIYDGFTVEASTAKPGEQKAIVTYSGMETEYWITVDEPIAPTEIELQTADGLLARGKTLQIVTSICPEDAQGYSILWESSDPAVASVDELGVVTGVAKGECELTATVSDYYGNPVCQNSVVIMVHSPFRVAWIRFWRRIKKLFHIRVNSDIFNNPEVHHASISTAEQSVFATVEK